MNQKPRFLIALGLLFVSANACSSEKIVLHEGFVTKVHCEGRLLVSSIGNDEIVQLEALPQELGCGVLLKPNSQAIRKLSKSAELRTNLIMETTGGTVSQEVQVTPKGGLPKSFIYYRKGGDV